MSIQLEGCLHLASPAEYKLHLASWNGREHPLDVFVRDRAEWDGWNRWRSGRDDFNRPRVLSLLDFYSEPEAWLFGGVFHVSGRRSVPNDYSYEVERDQVTEPYVGRLKVRFRRPGRGRSLRLERYLGQMFVSEILPEPYAGERFPGYENINHAFRQLEPIFRSQRPDWKAALENVKGVYLIADRSNGRHYVGAAYGSSGVWARWSSYIETGHGGTDELSSLIRRKGLEYARENFQVSLLEYRPMKADDQVIIERESFWKNAVLSRAPWGYNKN